MALAQYSELFWFPSGELAANVPARVFQHSTNTLATLYADAGGTTPLANPAATSGTGRLEFYAEEGSYWVHIDSEAFEIAVGTAAQVAKQQDITDEVARADAAYAALLHAARHAQDGADPVTLSIAQITGLAAALSGLLSRAGGTITGDLTIEGYSVLAGAQANGDFTVFGQLAAQGNTGFFGATPVARPPVSGSWTDGSAGESLAAALATLGLIINNTTP